MSIGMGIHTTGGDARSIKGRGLASGTVCGKERSSCIAQKAVHTAVVVGVTKKVCDACEGSFLVVLLRFLWF